MPRSAKDNEDLRAFRREAIIAAATRVFALKGVANAKVKDIAEAAQLSHGLLYHYFSSKEAVFEALVEHMMAEVEEKLEMGDCSPLDCLTRLMCARRQQLESEHVDTTSVVMQAIVQGHALSDGLKLQLEGHLRRLTGRICGWIEQAQREGDIRDSVSAEDLTHMLLYMFRGMSIRWLPLPVPLPREETILALLRTGKEARDVEPSAPGSGKKT